MADKEMDECVGIEDDRPEEQSDLEQVLFANYVTKPPCLLFCTCGQNRVPGAEVTTRLSELERSNLSY